MGRKKKELDTDEINEIVDIFIETQLNGNGSLLSYNGVFTFNKQIADNSEYKRKDGSLYTLYSYNIWAGTYKDQDNYGKKRIDEIKEKYNEVLSDKDYTLSNITEIIYSLLNKPNLLISKLSKIFADERKKYTSLQTSLNYYKKKAEMLEEKLEKTNNAMVNLFFQSQSYNNSLNNMLQLSKSEDSICYEEFMELFTENEQKIIEKMQKKNFAAIENNVIPIKLKTDNDKYKRI